MLICDQADEFCGLLNNLDIESIRWVNAPKLPDGRVLHGLRHTNDDRVAEIVTKFAGLVINDNLPVTYEVRSGSEDDALKISNWIIQRIAGINTEAYEGILRVHRSVINQHYNGIWHRDSEAIAAYGRVAGFGLVDGTSFKMGKFSEHSYTCPGNQIWVADEFDNAQLLHRTPRATYTGRRMFAGMFEYVEGAGAGFSAEE